MYTPFKLNENNKFGVVESKHTTMSAFVLQFVNGLKSRNREEQNKAAQDLFQYVKTELREMPQDELVQFFDEFNHHIFDMVSSSDAYEKKGGVLAISAL